MNDFPPLDAPGGDDDSGWLSVWSTARRPAYGHSHVKLSPLDFTGQFSMRCVKQMLSGRGSHARQSKPMPTETTALRIAAFTRTHVAVTLAVLVFGSGLPLASAHAIPPWARKYNMACSGCHFPVVPRLNSTGLVFKWAGYRMPNEIGDNVEVKKIEEYFGAQGVARYAYARTQRSDADVNGTSVPGASIFAAGALGKYFGAFLQFERTPDAAVDLIAQMSAVIGSEQRFGGLRIGTGHALTGGMVAGFDRPTGILAPLPLESSVTAAVPFSFTGDGVGIDGYVVFDGRDRLGLQVLNSRLPSQPAAGAVVTRLDLALSNQFIWGKHGDGITAMAFLGQMTGVNSNAPEVVSRYTRFAVSANRWISNAELGGGYVYGNDTRLPVGANLFTNSSLSGNGYWLSGLYALPKSLVNLFVRYEELRPRDTGLSAAPRILSTRIAQTTRDPFSTSSLTSNRVAASVIGSDEDLLLNGARRYVAGVVLPLNLPQYLRLTLEGFVLAPQASSLPKRSGVTAEVQINF